MENVVMNKRFWKDKKVLITGHTGLKGGWLSLWLMNSGAHVIGYALDPPTHPSLFNLTRLDKRVTSINGDIRNLEYLKSVITEHKPEILIHMAAQALVRYSYKDPIETYSTNVMGTVNVLEAVRQSRCIRAVIIVTSDKCYENKEWHWGYRENEAMGGHDPYSSSKGCAELVTSAYRNSYFSEKDYEYHGVAVASVRAGNVIAGGDWAEDRLIPDIIKAFMDNRPVIIRSPNAVRPWQHVLEPLNGYLCLAEKLWEAGPKFAGVWNFGPNDEDSKPVSWIVEKLAKLWDKGARWDLDTARNPHEAGHLKLDCSKAKTLLGWSPNLSLSTALEWIIEWYRSYMQNEDMYAVTEGEILRFESLVNKEIA